jgi:hypothetical protein
MSANHEWVLISGEPAKVGYFLEDLPAGALPRHASRLETSTLLTREPDQPHPDTSISDEEKAGPFAGAFDNLRKLVDGVPLDPPASPSFLSG